MVGLALRMGFGSIGGKLFVADPTAFLLAIAQALPGGLSTRFEADDGAEVRGFLDLQAVATAPEGEFPLGLGLVGSDRSALDVLLDRRGPCRVVVDLSAHLVRIRPASRIRHQAHQASRRDVLRIGQNGKGKVLDPLGLEPVGLTPEGQLDVRFGVPADLHLGGVIGGEVFGFDRGLGRSAEQTAEQQHDRRHDPPPPEPALTHRKRREVLL